MGANGARAGSTGLLRSSWGALALASLGLGGAIVGSGFAVGPADTAGRVVDVHGSAVAGAAIELRQDAHPTAAGTTDRNGGYHLSGGLRVRPSTVLVSAADYLPAAARAGGVTVLHQRPVVQGRTVDERGAPVPNARVAVELAGGAIVETMSDGDGFFHLGRALLPGPALVTITAAGHEMAIELADLTADGAAQVASTLARQVAYVELATTPPGQRVRVDGEAPAGCTGTPCTIEMAPGEHTLSVESDLYEPWSHSMTAWQGDRLPISVQLVRKTGTLAVSAPGGPGAVLLVDGSPVDARGWTGLLPTGRHTVGFRSPDRWPWSAWAEVGWNATTSLAVSALAISPGNEGQFTANMAAYLDALPGRYGVYIGDLAGGRTIRYHAGDPMEAASVIKLPLAAYLESQAQSGAIKMDDQVTLEDGDFMGGTGTLYGRAASGDKYTYHDLLALMVQQSDNTAWQVLKRVLGADKVDAYASGAGFGDCHQSDDMCSAASAGMLAGRLAAGRLLDADHTRDLMNLLQTTAFNDRINYYLPGVTIAHKVGMDGSVMNDTGVVLGAHPFVVSVFTDSGDPDQGIEVIRLVARAAAQLFS